MVTTPSTALVANGLSFGYGDGPHVLNSIELEIERGEIVTVLAPNGGGKTTLLKLLAGLLVPTAGSVRLDGVPLSELKPVERFQRMGFVLQNPGDQLFAQTVAEDVAFGPTNLGLHDRQIRARRDEALAAVGISHLADRGIAQLSHGEMRRVALAGVLAMGPSILLLDEPTSGLDPASELSIFRLIRRLNEEEGVTVLMATHTIDLLPEYVSRIVVLSAGRIQCSGMPREVFSQAQLLHNSCLRQPYVTQLVRSLDEMDGVRATPLPMTVKESHDWMRSLLERRVGRPTTTDEP